MAAAAGGQGGAVREAAGGRGAADDRPDYSLGVERVSEIWRELDALARLEHAEMEVGFRSYGPDWESIMASEEQGIIKCLVARRGSALVGYLGWSIGLDLESRGVVIANQLSWYVLPGQYAVASHMLDWLIAECRRIGVKFLYLSHPERGRGRSLGRVFERRGAMHTSTHYTLTL